MSNNCFFCQNKIQPSFKEVDMLKRYITDRGKIVGRSKTGCCQKHQKRVAKAVKRARHLALLPYDSRL
ncbi:30S ribosomal protein S18 [Patescibacteria group bacterium]